MGHTLSRAAQWTSCCKLESTPLNEIIVTQILNYVENFVSRHPQEAEHVFEEPLQWNTTLAKSDFKEDYIISAIGVKSLDKDSEGKPLLQFFPPSVSVRNFNQLSKLLHMAEDRKRREVQACLEENRDLVAKMVGRRLADTPDENVSALELDIRVKLFILLKHIDEKILNKFASEIAKHATLLPSAVEEEVEFLKEYCTEGGKRLLKSVRYTSDYEFPNGCRAPPWRQLLGEICYVVIEPCDAEPLYITCSSTGVYLNAGLDKEEDESLYEKQGDSYEDITTLLKRVSPHFEEYMRKQYFVEQKPRKSIHVAHLDYEIEQAQPKTPEEREWEKVQQALYGRRKREPCHRWRNLGVLNMCSSAEEEDITMSFAERKRLGSKTKSMMKGGITAASSIGLTASQRRRSIVASFSEEHFSESSSESDEEEEQTERRPDTSTELQSEYWQVQKLVKYLKAADQTATVLVLCAMMELDLMKEVIQLAILDLGGLDLLLNLLDTTDIRSKIGSLKILSKISQNVIIRQTIVNMRGLQRMVNNLDLPVKELQALASETIAHVAKFRRARRIVRTHGGIRKLVKLLDCFPYAAKQGEVIQKNLEVARCGASALWSLSKSSKNKEAIRKAGGIPLLGLLLRSPYEEILIPVVGTLQECASQKNYRVAIQNEGMVKDLVKNLSSENEELQMLCASAIFKCAEDKLTRDLVRSHHGLQPLVSLLSKAENKQLLAAATGAIWKCSISMENVAIFQEYKALQALIGLLTDQPEQVLINVVGALGQFAQIQANKSAICNGGGIRALINLLNGTNQALLVNVAKTVGACATERDNVAIIDQLDGVRLVWSLLKNPNAEVQASAAWAICPCIENAKDAGEMVLFLIGGLKLIIHLLKSPSNEVLTSICAVIAKLAKDKEILGVLSDRGVVPLLAKLSNTSDVRLRCHLAEAIGHCCMWGSNRACFGEHGAVGPLVQYLESNDNLLLLNTTMALYQLSKEPNNIITMHEEGVVEERRGDSFLPRTFWIRAQQRNLRTERPKMNTVVFNKLSSQVLFEDKAKEVEMSSRNYLEVIDGQHPDLLCSSPAIRDSQAARHRRSGGRPSGSKVRHKRQALQDMARPLKQWLYKHRDNPYPTKTEKILLALGSQMTLVQVSNWFANARRRLKNTVRQPDLSWALRIKLYNKYVQGNAERLSVSSDDSCSQDGDNPQRTQSGPEDLTKPLYQSVIKKEGSPMVGVAIGMDPGLRSAVEAEDYVSPPKYKSSLLHRYLNDSLRHVMVANAVMDARKRNHSGSFSSNEFDDELLSPSSSEAEAHFVYRAEATDHGSSQHDKGNGGVAATQKVKVKAKDETYWKEINAAMALTNLAQGKDSVSGTTSCIIQKSSHIAEVKTVKKVLALTSSHPKVETSKHSSLSKFELNSPLNEENCYLWREKGLFKAEEEIILSC